MMMCPILIGLFFRFVTPIVLGAIDLFVTFLGQINHTLIQLDIIIYFLLHLCI